MIGLLIAIMAPPALEDRATMPAAVQAEIELSGREIIERAQDAAGGELFVHPRTLRLTGYNIIRDEAGGETLWDRYAMWRQFPEQKTDAHTADGKVRIEAWSNGSLAMLLTFDGHRTYNEKGLVADQSANAMWGANFGFGAIRNALDEGWSQKRKADRLIDGNPTFMVALTDPSGGETLFGIRQADSAIVYVGFDTPKGWHERRYSEFFSKPGSDWVQAGRVRLFYDGVKSNEAVWTDYEVGTPLPDALFVVKEPPEEPSF
ncbi:hypothetical protein [Parvularcula lutaonensis]|uniref:DUF2092 domain-containing protein n=1 Tax=Parvularcula lutaonensis TaxID=491923 RepID=A0ABV7MCQ5_9PROT|nr:hypothetical protein [Parvularcula lutaonensis]GGY38556.1 hypothetical protein GCM10007148_03590 [Parvularcula lutaonensis]